MARKQSLRKIGVKCWSYLRIYGHEKAKRPSPSLLRRDLRWRGFSPKLVVGYNKGVSNIPLFEFDRSYVRVQLTRQF